MDHSAARTGRLIVLLAGVVALLVGLTAVPRTARAESEQAPEIPTIELQPYCWTTEGVNTVTIVGHSFAANEKVHVYDATGGQSTETATTDEYGTFKAQLDVPINGSGSEIRATDPSGEKDLASAAFPHCDYGPVTAKAVPACSDDAIPSLHLVGTGWSTRSDAPIDLRLDSGYESAIAETTLDPIANFDFVWSPGVELKPGDYAVYINQNSPTDESVENYAAVQFRVGCPQVTVTPLCSQAGAPPDRLTITLSGTGFDPTQQLRFLFDGDGKAQEFTYDFPVPPTPDPYATGESPPPPNGTFGPLTINPYYRSAGTYTLELFQRDAYGAIVRDWITTVRFPCYQPSVSVAVPDCGPAADSAVPGYYSITVTGNDFVPNDKITVVFDPDYLAGSGYPPEAFSGLTDAAGVISAAINPIHRPEGKYRILVYQDTDLGHYEASTYFAVPCAEPPTASLSITPLCEPPADGQAAAYTLSLTGSGFLPGPVTVVLDPTGSAFTGTVEADASGYFAGAQFVTDGKLPGSYQVIAYQDNDGERVEGVATLTVPCLSVTLDPTCATPADGQPGVYAVTATGVGFDPGPVDLVFDPSSLAPLAVQVQADSAGSFVVPLALDGRPAGVYDLVASQSSSYGLFEQAVTQLLVPCDLVTLRITPTAGPRGFVPTVEGFGLAPLAKLMLYWDFGIGASVPIAVETDANGHFSRQVTIFQHDFLGLRHMTVQNPSDPTAYTEVIAPYLVAAAPVAPPFSADESFAPPADPVILQR